MRRLALLYPQHDTQTRSRQDVTSDRLQPTLLLYSDPIGDITDRQSDPFRCHAALDQMLEPLRFSFQTENLSRSLLLPTNVTQSAGTIHHHFFYPSVYCSPT